ncbi:MAG: DnaD domain protein [Clostridiales bacterium]|nr:DnaD domain protein [Clostridiales bacterium]
MSFKIKTPDFDLGTIEIENIFINDFMPSADGLYVKVYLMALKLAKDHNESEKFGNETLSNILNVPLSDVIQAWKYWQSKSVVNIINVINDTHFDVEFVTLRQLFIDKNYYSPHKSQDLIVKSVKTKRYNSLFERINEKLGNELQANERLQLMTFLDENELSDDLVVEAFNSLKRGAYTNRITTVKKRLFNWVDLNIKTVDDLVNYTEKTSEKYVNYKKILESLGFPWANPSSGDIQVIDKWLLEFKFEMSFILDTIIEITKKTRNPSMNYLDKVFSNIFNGEEKPVYKKTAEKKAIKKNAFHNYSTDEEQNLSEQELEKLLVKNLKSR